MERDIIIARCLQSRFDKRSKRIGLLYIEVELEHLDLGMACHRSVFQQLLEQFMARNNRSRGHSKRISFYAFTLLFKIAFQGKYVCVFFH